MLAYVANVAFYKLSVGTFLLRFAITSRVYLWILRSSLVIVALWGIITFFSALFLCNPIRKQWDFRITTGYCRTRYVTLAIMTAQSAVSILSDWLFVSIAWVRSGRGVHCIRGAY